MRALEVAQLVEHINNRHGTEFKLIARYLEGENQGAYALRDFNNNLFVLKWKLARTGWRG